MLRTLRHLPVITHTFHIGYVMNTHTCKYTHSASYNESLAIQSTKIIMLFALMHRTDHNANIIPSVI
jgi:hypothetical protein